jgi:hypothetical protein
MTITADSFRSDKLLFTACKTLVFDWMEANGASLIVADFSGGGDDGSFDSYASVYGPDQSNYSEAHRLSKLLSGAKAGSEADNTSLDRLVVVMSAYIEDAAEHNVDWVNNEGGRGKVEWILDGTSDDGAHYRRGIHLTVEQRVESYDTHTYSIEGLVQDDAEVTP